MRHLRAVRNLGRAWESLPRCGGNSQVMSQTRNFCSQRNSDKEISEKQQEELDTGRDLAKLSLMMRRAKDAIPKTALQGSLLPETQVRLEQEINEAEELIREALEKSGRLCTVDELGDRINNNTVPIPAEALDYKGLLRAEILRDSFEDTMVALDVLPPPEAWVDGSGKSFCRLERREEKRKALMAKDRSPIQEFDDAKSDDVRVSAVEQVPRHELMRRKAEMESASKLQSVLRGFDTALLQVSRVHKVGKGGTSLSMRALVVIGDRNGTAGYGEGKSETVAHAVERACRDAKRNLLHIDRKQDRTIHHRVTGSYVKSRVSLWPAPQGTGISANNNFSAVFQLFGIKDVGAKLHGPRSLTNAVKALFNALSRVHTADTIAATRGLQIVTTNPSFRKTESSFRTRSLHQAQ